MKKFKENNKGFSLVELIVVIAIMVVLIAVLGSTILGYVEKSKHSKDIQALDAIKTACSTYVADGEGNYADDTTYTLTDLLGLAPLPENAPQGATQQPYDPNDVLQNTLSEVFTFNQEGTSATFNGSSKAFRNISSDDVLIRFEDGAVSIYVESQEDDYDDYEVGDGSALAANNNNNNGDN